MANSLATELCAHKLKCSQRLMPDGSIFEEVGAWEGKPKRELGKANLGLGGQAVSAGRILPGGP